MVRATDDQGQATLDGFASEGRADAPGTGGKNLGEVGVRDGGHDDGSAAVQVPKPVQIVRASGEATTVEDCEWALLDVQSAKPAAKQALRRGLMELERDAVVERERLRARLERMWAWLDAHGEEGNSERTDKCVEAIRGYEAWSDVIYRMRKESRVERVEV